MCRNILLKLQLLVKRVLGQQQKEIQYFRPVELCNGSLTVPYILLVLQSVCFLPLKYYIILVSTDFFKIIQI